MKNIVLWDEPITYTCLFLILASLVIMIVVNSCSAIRQEIVAGDDNDYEYQIEALEDRVDELEDQVFDLKHNQ